MISVIGIALLSASIIGFGLSYGSALKAEKLCLEELILLCDRIHTRIECFRQPLPDIFRNFSSPYLDGCGFNSILKEKGIKAAVAALAPYLPVTVKTEELLKELSTKLGSGYAEEALKLCARVKNDLRGELALLNKSFPSRMKLSLTLSFAAAAMAAILFV